MQESGRIFTDQGKTLISAGKYRDAEQLYLSCNMLDAALTMYHDLKHYDSVVRLITIYRPDQLVNCHAQIGNRLQREGNRKGAESHFLAVIFKPLRKYAY